MPLGGAYVNRVSRMADTSIVLALAWGYGPPDVDVRFNAHLRVTTRDGRAHQLSIERLEGLAPILRVAGATVRQATFTPRGELSIVLEDETVIEAENHPRYESWEVNGPGDIVVVASIGGPDEPAIWGSHRSS